MLGDPLEQALGELGVVGQPGLPHQRRVRRESRDPRIGRERKDAVEIGSVGEDAGGDLVEHCSHDIGPLPTRASRHELRSERPGEQLAGDVRSGASDPGCAASALVGAPGVLDQHGPAARRPARQDVGVGVAEHPRCRQVEIRARRSVSSMPGAGLRQSHGPDSSARRLWMMRA